MCSEQREGKKIFSRQWHAFRASCRKVVYRDALFFREKCVFWKDVILAGSFVKFSEYLHESVSLSLARYWKGGNESG